MGKLADELRKKFRTPQEALQKLGLDSRLLDDAPRSQGDIEMSKIVLTRKGTFLAGACAAYVMPKLAMDAKLDLAPVFKDVTAKNFGSKKKAIAAEIRAKAKPLLAKDAELDHIEELLDKLEKAEVVEGADTDPNSGLPMTEAEMEKKAKDKAKDEEPWGKVRAAMKEKGASDEDLDAYDAMMRGEDEEEEEEEETEEEKKAREKKEAADKKAKDKAAKDKKAKDEEGEKVDKKAMDEAIALASDTATKNALKIANDIRAAEREVRPYVGELSVAFDSAVAVYQTALKNMGVSDASRVSDPIALKAMLKAQPLPGAKRREAIMAHDASPSSDFAAAFPDAMAILLR
jgi:uncharacterized protein